MAQVVLITGTSKGIGEGLALHLAKDPQRRYKVYATMRNMATRASDITAKAGNLLDTTLFLHELDVTKQDSIDRTVKEIIDKEGRIDVLGMYKIFSGQKYVKITRDFDLSKPGPC